MVENCDKRVYKPSVDEYPVPCDKYIGTDCVYPSDDVRAEYFGISTGCNLTALINAMIETLKAKDKKITELERKINSVI